VAGTCGYGEGLSSSINAGNFLTSCKVYWLAPQEAAWSKVVVNTAIYKICRVFLRLSVRNGLNNS
jgi:hypothetical protein